MTSKPTVKPQQAREAKYTEALARYIIQDPVPFKERQHPQESTSAFCSKLPKGEQPTRIHAMLHASCRAFVLQRALLLDAQGSARGSITACSLLQMGQAASFRCLSDMLCCASQSGKSRCALGFLGPEFNWCPGTPGKSAMKPLCPLQVP